LSGGSRTLRELGLLLAALAALAALSLGLVRLLGPEEAEEKEPPSSLSLSIEKGLSSALKSALLAQREAVEAQEVRRTLEAVVGRLLERTDPLPYPVEVLVLDTPEINALSFPGGLIVVYTGLLWELENPEELAAVLAHELGHTVHRDSLKALARELGTTVLLSALGGQKAEAVVQRILRELVGARFSRAAEARADTFALDLLARAQLNPLHFASVLERLRRESRGPLGRFLLYIDSHPELDSRIRGARERAARLGLREKPFALDWEAFLEALPSGF